MKRDLLALTDLSAEEMQRLIDRAIELKARRQRGILDRPLTGKTVGLLFDKASTRTRVSFEAAANRLGGGSIFISAGDTQLARNEPIADTARVLGGYLDALVIRTYAQQTVADYARHAAVPVINALTDDYHPTQILADLMTVVEVRGGFEGLRIAWVGDGNNMANSWLNAAAVLGLELALACPEGYLPRTDLIEKARRASGAKVTLSVDPREAVAGADVVNTDVWASMGHEGQEAERATAFAGFTVDSALMALAAREAVVLHCLPAHRGEEITAEVLEGPQSAAWRQAENKMHMAAAILEWVVGGVET
ncbi:MAG: ornithine carbamoyltransferase [Desulfobacteraceae bacterium]|nr:ornithine carbamoyltransferase [Desulfobacteraceae bacterium]MDD3991797.1 ornithine carbamoyltransferase [Desulfobacteraceae bacterium]